MIATLSIHHSFTLSLEAQFQQILLALTFLLYSLDCFRDNGTGVCLSLVFIIIYSKVKNLTQVYYTCFKFFTLFLNQLSLVGLALDLVDYCKTGKFRGRKLSRFHYLG